MTHWMLALRAFAVFATFAALALLISAFWVQWLLWPALVLIIFSWPPTLLNKLGADDSNESQDG